MAKEKDKIVERLGKRRFLLIVAIGVVLVAVLMMGVQYIRFRYTKSFSPESEVVFNDGPFRMSVFYNRPFKKGRKIFGELVPYGKVWRTGANEATVFSVNRPVTIGGQRLKGGKYSLWTIPDSMQWTIIFNSEYGQWGVNSNMEANLNPKRDELKVDVPVTRHPQIVEQFTIELIKSDGMAEMILMWDDLRVTIPFEYQ